MADHSQIGILGKDIVNRSTTPVLPVFRIYSVFLLFDS